MIHNSSICESKNIGEGTKIWAFVHILPGAVIGSVTIGHDVFIGPNVTFTNDKNPKSKNKEFEVLRTLISDGVSIGANSTLLPGIQVGEGAIIGAGSVVTKNVAAGATVYGNPAKSNHN